MILPQIYVQCDATACLTEQLVPTEEADTTVVFDLPPGWSRRGKKTFCPRHTPTRR